MVYHFIDTCGCNPRGPVPERAVVVEKAVLRPRPIRHGEATALWTKNKWSCRKLEAELSVPGFASVQRSDTIFTNTWTNLEIHGTEGFVGELMQPGLRNLSPLTCFYAGDLRAARGKSTHLCCLFQRTKGWHTFITCDLWEINKAIPLTTTVL